MDEKPQQSDDARSTSQRRPAAWPPSCRRCRRHRRSARRCPSRLRRDLPAGLRAAAAPAGDGALGRRRARLDAGRTPGVGDLAHPDAAGPVARPPPWSAGRRCATAPRRTAGACRRSRPSRAPTGPLGSPRRGPAHTGGRTDHAGPGQGPGAAAGPAGAQGSGRRGVALVGLCGAVQQGGREEPPGVRAARAGRRTGPPRPPGLLLPGVEAARPERAAAAIPAQRAAWSAARRPRSPRRPEGSGPHAGWPRPASSRPRHRAGRPQAVGRGTPVRGAGRVSSGSARVYGRRRGRPAAGSGAAPDEPEPEP